jgi:hypothetical protein
VTGTKIRWSNRVSSDYSKCPAGLSVRFCPFREQTPYWTYFAFPQLEFFDLNFETELNRLNSAIQAVYSASLILESMQPLIEENPVVAGRLQQAKHVLNAVNTDLRSYMVSLRAETPAAPLIPSLQKLILNSRFQGLLDIDLGYNNEPALKPMQVHHAVAIVQESLSNALRHAPA